MSELQCVVVTPEKTELDTQAVSVTVPMFDGELGILKGHSPLVGRLGYGLLKIRTGSDVQSFFIEGGFVQVADDVVSVLTDRLIATSEVTSSAAEQAMKQAMELPTDAESQAAREKAMTRARAMSRVASL